MGGIYAVCLVTMADCAMITLPIRTVYLDAIARGDKTIEGRLDGARFAGLSAGDRIVFEAVDAMPASRLVCLLRAIRRYPDFDAMLRAEGLSSALPGVCSLSEGVSVYRSFPGYDRDRQRGVVALEVQPF